MESSIEDRIDPSLRDLPRLELTKMEVRQGHNDSIRIEIQVPFSSSRVDAAVIANTVYREICAFQATRSPVTSTIALANPATPFEYIDGNFAASHVTRTVVEPKSTIPQFLENGKPNPKAYVNRAEFIFSRAKIYQYEIEALRTSKKDLKKIKAKFAAPPNSKKIKDKLLREFRITQAEKDAINEERKENNIKPLATRRGKHSKLMAEALAKAEAKSTKATKSAISKRK